MYLFANCSSLQNEFPSVRKLNFNILEENHFKYITNTWDRKNKKGELKAKEWDRFQGNRPQYSVKPQHLPILNTAFAIHWTSWSLTALEMPFKWGSHIYFWEWNEETGMKHGVSYQESDHSSYRSQVEEKNVAHLLTTAAQKVPGWCWFRQPNLDSCKDFWFPNLKQWVLYSSKPRIWHFTTSSEF